MVQKLVKSRIGDSTSGPSNTGRKTPPEIPQGSSCYISYPVGSVWGTCVGPLSREVQITQVQRWYSKSGTQVDLNICFQYLTTHRGDRRTEWTSLPCSAFSKKFFFEREVL